MNHVFEVEQPPEYIGENQERGIFGWMEVHPWINPNDSLETFNDQVFTRQTYMAIARDSVYESVLTYPGGFPSVLMNSFNSMYDEIRNQLGRFEDLNQTWAYDDCVTELTKVCIQSFQSAAKVYAELLEHAECLETVATMGLKLDDEEKALLKAIRATKQGE